MSILSEQLPLYEYSPIGARKIRVLHLETGGHEQPLRGSVEVVDVDSAIFVAISYVWGSPDREHSITIDKENGPKVIMLTESLNTLLRDVRTGFQSKRGKDLPMVLWVDQISINQENIEEKNVQVAMMRTIYETAHAVITYIGPMGNSERGIEMVKHFTLLKDGAQNNETDIPSPSLADYADSQSDEDWGSLGSLINRNWLDRVWIVQENVLNSRQILCCGTCLFPWDWLGLVADITNIPSLAKGLLYNGNQSDADLENDQYTRTVSNKPVKYGPGSGDPTYIRARIFKLGVLSQLRFDRVESSTSINLFWALLQDFGQLLCKDPRDTIFAIVGLATDAEELNIHPDYNKSPVDVFREVAARMILFYGHLAIIHFPVWIPRYGRDRPSWIPSWSCDQGYRWDATHYAFYPLGDGQQSKPRFEADEHVLVVDGVFLDEIEVSFGVWTPTMTDFSSAAMKSIVEFYDLGVFEEMCNYLSLDLWNLSPEDLERIVLFMVEHTSDSDIENARISIEAVVFSLQELRRIRNLQKPDCAIQYPEPNATTDNERSFDAQNLLLHTWQLAHRSICVTKSKRLCSVYAEHVEPGDQVVALFGGNFCYVLKNSERPGHHNLVGYSYLEGQMDGQIQEDPGWKSRIVTIRID
ncbi:heterokaryon incompatibility protein-domain-containing protein [Dendryphion nanum]|uniref:Heterokaryon incompatibility protein-domain-containing protein n=1 Tax=Dendryphion nanum TaxID=256645 RepID=A0A9P9IVJ4_9PLEO|nr:heterokaryon incompatibility protein-domain-containing protein [Dendryphion nanum]